jgi:hypothetical protein
MGHARKRLWVGVICCGLAGCAEAPLEYTEVKRIDEPVSAEDLTALLRVLRSLPDHRPPALPPYFAPPPDWPATRTLPVRELLAEEREAVQAGSDAQALAERMPHDRALDRALRREKMTRPQFVGLLLAVGVAMSRSQLRSEPDYEDALRRGHAALREIEADAASFAEYAEDQQFAILKKATWVTRLDRLEKLRQVPASNVQLVRQHRDLLRDVLPAEFLTDPLAAVAVFRDETGAPFEELPTSGRDADIRWDAASALRGDAP